MSRYDEFPDHPLHGVPQEVLEAAREVLQSAGDHKDVDPELVEPLADAVVSRLHERGFIKWQPAQ